MLHLISVNLKVALYKNNKVGGRNESSKIIKGKRVHAKEVSGSTINDWTGHL